MVKPAILLLFALGAAHGQTAALLDRATPTYENPTAKDRLNWFAYSTGGPPSLVGGLFSAAFGTAFNSPREYGPHWEGFSKRYGMRFTGVATGNAIEAGLGALWGEDPRYDRVAGRPFGKRIGHILKMTVMAKGRDGQLMPAYARYIGITGNNYLSNTWRAPSEATTGRATVRVGLGFLGRLTGNTFDEFWPDVKSKISR